MWSHGARPFDDDVSFRVQISSKSVIFFGQNEESPHCSGPAKIVLGEMLPTLDVNHPLNPTD